MKNHNTKEIAVLILIIALLIIVLIFSGVFYFKVFSAIMTGHVVYNSETQNQQDFIGPSPELNENAELLADSGESEE